MILSLDTKFIKFIQTFNYLSFVMQFRKCFLVWLDNQDLRKTPIAFMNLIRIREVTRAGTVLGIEGCLF